MQEAGTLGVFGGLLTCSKAGWRDRILVGPVNGGQQGGGGRTARVEDNVNSSTRTMTQWEDRAACSGESTQRRTIYVLQICPPFS